MRTEIQGDFKGYLTRFKMPSSKCFKIPIKSCLIIFLIQLVVSISFYMIETAPVLQVLLLLECMFMVSYYIAVLYKDFWNVVLEESKGLLLETDTEKYEIEFLWTRLGNYAKDNNVRDNNNFYDSEQFFDMLIRISHNDPDHSSFYNLPEEFFDDGNRYWYRHDPSLPIDMEIQAKAVMDSFSLIRKDTTRHTGPSIFFKYFCLFFYY